MADQRIRALERAAAEGDVPARIALLRARIQRGDPVDEPIIGTEVGGCVIEKRLAMDGGGGVFLGLHPRDGECVLRLILPGFAPERFFRTYRPWVDLNHPCLVDVLEVGRDRESCFMRLEHIHGETLEERLRRCGPLPWREAVEAGRDIALGLQVVHEAGHCHLHVTPDDARLDRLTGRVKLDPAPLDHSLPDVAEPPLIGRPFCMAPEQLRGDPFGPRTDLYALGVTLYVLLSDVRPFDGDTIMQTFQRILSAELDPPSHHIPELPEPLDRIVLSCLDREPTGRPASATALAEALEGLLGD